jgi:hypothetical protein
MNDEPLTYHKTHTIRVMSYRRDGLWVPLATVYSSPDNEQNGHSVTGNPDDRLPTQEAADAVAKKLGIEWIDSQFPSAAG